MATMLAAGSCLISSAALAQRMPTASDTSIFGVAYQVIDAKLPSGRRVVAANDPLLRTPASREHDVALANRRFADAVGLSTVALDDVVACTTRYDCSFKDDIVAAVSLRMASYTPDSAVVDVATRSFLAPAHPQAVRGVTWRSVALYEVRLARRAGRWIVLSVTPRAES